ncbi:MAG: LD-carboxypeptidase [Sporomusaceae bacterium]|nr:LD-carboxypeptidase [Sporomusaceae bacterium]
MNKASIKPKKLEKGQCIGLIAPASCGDWQEASAGIDLLQKLGYEVRIGRSVQQKWGYLAGSDAVRLRDLEEMFADPSIAAIFCLRGGYGAMRYLAELNYELLRQNPKILLGYSDVTALFTAISQTCGFPVFHGPMVASDLGRNPSDYTIAAMLRSLETSRPLGLISNPPEQPLNWLCPGEASGILTGGNLSLLAATLGTPYEIDTKNKILCLEEIGEEPYRIDRLLTQLRLAGKLQEAAGLVLGRFVNCEEEEPEQETEKGFSLQEVLQDRLSDLSIPILGNLAFGHQPDKTTLPFGVKARLSTSDGGLILAESAFTD